jgi:hypothetical protein
MDEAIREYEVGVGSGRTSLEVISKERRIRARDRDRKRGNFSFIDYII